MALSCTTSHNWKTCGWLYNEQLCQYEYVYNEKNAGNEWTYEKISSDSNCDEHTFVKPKERSLGNNNKQCKIYFKSVSYDGEYVCQFQRCNPEENGFCKSQASTKIPMFSASMFVKVK